MTEIVVKINGKNVVVPAYEVRSLIQSLLDHYDRLLVAGKVSGAPREGYVTYEECERILSAHYTQGNMSRYHTGGLWAAMWHLTQDRKSGISFDIICTICEAQVGKVDDNSNCRHYFNTSIGYSMNIISRKSILNNFEKFMLYPSRTIGDAVKKNYMLLVKSLRRQ